MSEKQKQIDDMWWSIQDIIGPASDWPQWIKDLFFTRNLNHAQRPLICAFIVFNGLNPEVNNSFLKYFSTVLTLPTIE